MIEEQNDIYNILAKANYAKEDKEGAWRAVFGEELPKHFGLLEANLHGDFFGSKLTAGDIAIFSIINIVLDLDPQALDKFQKLKAHYDRVAAVPGVAKYLANPPAAYFKRV